MNFWKNTEKKSNRPLFSFHRSSRRKMPWAGTILLSAMIFLLLALTIAEPVLAAEENPYEVEVGKYGMTPIYAGDVADGTYEISVDSNSPFFKIIAATLTVKDGKMTADFTIGSHSYLHVFLGTKDDADANEAAWIDPTEDGDNYIFHVPVEALDTPIDCAAYSKRRKKWYDRKLLFDATSLPEGAVKIELPDYDAIERGLELLEDSGSISAGDSGNGDGSISADDSGNGDGSISTDGSASEGAGISENGSTGQGSTDLKVYGGASLSSAYTPVEPMEIPYEDGEYSIEVSMAGGTGRVTVSSPTLLIVKDGRAYAKILWSSSYYDWMIVGGEIYQQENTDGGNSYFIIPIPAMDSIVPVIADTTAMGDPVAIEYSLTFYADTIGNKGQIPQEAAKKVIIAAVIVIIAGGILNYAVKKKRKR